MLLRSKLREARLVWNSGLSRVRNSTRDAAISTGWESRLAGYPPCVEALFSTFLVFSYVAFHFLTLRGVRWRILAVSRVFLLQERT